MPKKIYFYWSSTEAMEAKTAKYFSAIVVALSWLVWPRDFETAQECQMTANKKLLEPRFSRLINRLSVNYVCLRTFGVICTHEATLYQLWVQ